MVVNSSRAFALEKHVISLESSNKQLTFLKFLPFQETLQNLAAGFFSVLIYFPTQAINFEASM